MAIKQNQISKNSKKHYGAKLLTEERGKWSGLFSSRLIFYFALSQMQGNCCRSSLWQRNTPSHHEQDFWPPRPWWLCILTQVLAYPPLPKSPQTPMKLPAISKATLNPWCLPFFNTNFWEVPKKSVSRQVPTTLTNWEAYSLPLPITYWDPQTSFSSIYTLSSHQTQKMGCMKCKGRRQ